jgi:hypothetical protein
MPPLATASFRGKSREMLAPLFKKKMIDQIAIAVQLDPTFAGYRVAPEAIEFGQENKGVAVELPSKMLLDPLDAVLGNLKPVVFIFVASVDEVFKASGDEFRLAGIEQKSADAVFDDFKGAT